jgi:uncharacterized protein YndB with AHSA1/START domain
MQEEFTMSKDLIARASVIINADRDKVWDALVNPKAIKQYMFGADVVTDWREQGPIVWKGEYQSKPYEDKGVILKFEPGHMLQYSHFSPMSGLPDKPENYHTVTIEVSGGGNKTQASLSQDHNATEKERDESQKNWTAMLDGMKKYVEH